MEHFCFHFGEDLPTFQKTSVPGTLGPWSCGTYQALESPGFKFIIYYLASVSPACLFTSVDLFSLSQKGEAITHLTGFCKTDDVVKAPGS